MVKQWEWYTNLAYLFLPLLLLLIVIYNGVGMYDKIIIMDWYDDDNDVGILCQPTC